MSRSISTFSLKVIFSVFLAGLFTTTARGQCQLTAPFVEEFDNSPWVSGEPGDIDNCWDRDLGDYPWEVGNGPTNSNYGGPDGDYPGHGSGNYMFTEATSAEDGDITGLRTPWIDVTALTVPRIRFFHHFYVDAGGLGAAGRFTVLVDSGNGWNSVAETLQQTHSDQSDPWSEWTIDLPDYDAADSVRIMFEVEYGDTYGDYAIDNVEMLEAPSCLKPSDLNASALDASSAELSWTSQDNGSEWEVEYGPSGFTQGNGTDSVLVTNNPATISGLTEDTEYDFYIREICTPGDSSFWSGSASATTLCLPIAAPFYEDFNSSPFSTGSPGSIDPCWDRNPSSDEFLWMPDDGGTTSSGTGPDDDIPGGGNYMHTDGSDGDPGDRATLTTPLIDMGSLSDPQFRFYYHFYGVEIDSFFVSINNGSGWSDLETIVGEQHDSTDDEWTPYTAFLPGYAGDTVRFRFEAIQGDDFYCDYSIDSVMLREAPACPTPSSLEANALSYDSLELSWTSVGPGSEWEVEYGPSGFSQGNGDTVTFTSNPDTLTGLSPAEEYDFYIREVCGPGDTTDWSVVPLTQLMPCRPAYTATYKTGFDGTDTDVPLCWSVIEEPGNLVQVVNSTDNGFGPYSSPQMIELHGNGPGGAPDTAVAISPRFSDLSDGDKRVRMQIRKEISSHSDTLIIGTMSDPTDFSTWTPYDYIFNDEIPSQQWKDVTQKLTETGQINGEYVGLRHDTGRTWELYVDDFVYETIPPTDIGVPSIEHPSTETACVFDSTQIEVEVKNFGSDPQSNFDIAYTIDGGTPEVETISQTLQPDSSMVYSFSPSTALNSAGTYEIDAFPMLANDTSAYNDTASHEILIGSGSTTPNTSDHRVVPGSDATIEDTVFICGNDFETYGCGRILTLNIDSLTHEDALDELDIQLVSPEGTTLDLWMQLGSYNDEAMSNLTFTDTASEDITNFSGDPVTGAYRPEDAAGFAKFDGEQMNGMWRLRIFNDDYSDDDSADFHGWSMRTLEPNKPQPELGSSGDTTICQDESILLDPGQEPDWSYHWDNNGTERERLVVGDFLTPQQSYTYSVTVTNENPLNLCSTSDTMDIYVDTCKTTSVHERENSSIDFEIRPNPASDRLFIESDAVEGNFRYELVDIQGRSIKSKSSEADERSSIDVSGLSQGVYILKGYRDQNELFQEKVVIE